MTEKEWRSTTDFRAMCAVLAGRPLPRPRTALGYVRAFLSRRLVAPPPRVGLSVRRLRLLFAAVCDAHLGHPGAGPQAGECRAAARVVERFADGAETPADRAELGRYPDLTATYEPSVRERLVRAGLHPVEPDVPAWPALAPYADWGILPRPFAALLPGTSAAGCALIRDVAGNPFRPADFSADWRTATAVGLAGAIYAEKAFDRLPILADCLEEAGCSEPAVLAHCRGDGPHVRGCWVVDLVLGKS